MEWPQFNRAWAICSWSLAVLTSWYKFPYMNIEEQMQLPHIERKRTNDVGVHQHVEDSRWILTVPLYPKLEKAVPDHASKRRRGSCGGQCPSSFRSLFSKTVTLLEILHGLQLALELDLTHLEVLSHALVFLAIILVWRIILLLMPSSVIQV